MTDTLAGDALDDASTAVPDGLTAQQAAAVGALMSSPTIEQAAKAVGVHERTLRRWLAGHEPFKLALRREQRAAMAAVTSRLQQSAGKAVETLETVMDDAEAPHASKVTAARALLELAHERIDMQETTDRLAALEMENERRKRGEGP